MTGDVNTRKDEVESEWMTRKQVMQWFQCSPDKVDRMIDIVKQDALPMTKPRPLRLRAVHIGWGIRIVKKDVHSILPPVA